MRLLNYRRKKTANPKESILQSGKEKDRLECFWDAIEKYATPLYIKDNEHVSIQHIRYQRGTLDGTIDCLLFTYKNEDRTKIFERLKQSGQNPYKTRFLPIIYDCIYDGEHTYVVEEAINGDNLGVIKEYREDGCFSQREVRNIAIDVCRALEILHGLGILHLDIKPENIVAKADTSGYKLIDFNASVLIEDVSGLQEYSHTRGYESPEHKNMRMADERTDQYSLGMTMYKLLTNEDHNTNSSDDFEKLPGTKGGLKNIIKKCIKLEKEERYKNVIEMRAALEGRKVRDDIDSEEQELKQDLKDARAEVERLEKEISYLREKGESCSQKLTIAEIQNRAYKKQCDKVKKINILLLGSVILLLGQIIYMLLK